jgi:hypothetical protein
MGRMGQNLIAHGLTFLGSAQPIRNSGAYSVNFIRVSMAIHFSHIHTLNSSFVRRLCINIEKTKILRVSKITTILHRVFYFYRQRL